MSRPSNDCRVDRENGSSTSDSSRQQHRRHPPIIARKRACDRALGRRAHHGEDDAGPAATGSVVNSSPGEATRLQFTEPWRRGIRSSARARCQDLNVQCETSPIAGRVHALARPEARRRDRHRRSAMSARAPCQRRRSGGSRANREGQHEDGDQRKPWVLDQPP